MGLGRRSRIGVRALAVWLLACLWVCFVVFVGWRWECFKRVDEWSDDGGEVEVSESVGKQCRYKYRSGSMDYEL